MRNDRDLVAVAEEAARAAAAYIRAAERPAPGAWDRKAAADFVTGIDRESERLIAERLRAATPEATVIGEELTAGTAVPDRGLAWIVDPLDGTTNYLHGYPAYAVSIGAAVDGKLVAGVVLDVERDACHAGTLHGPETALQVSGVEEPSHALLGTGFPFKEPATRYQDRWNREFLHFLRSTSGVRRAGSAALDLTDVALGRLDGFWEYGLAPWDAAAGIVLIRAAGGCVTDRDGRDVEAPPADGPLVAGNPTIHAWLLQELDRFATVPAGPDRRVSSPREDAR